MSTMSLFDRQMDRDQETCGDRETDRYSNKETAPMYNQLYHYIYARTTKSSRVRVRVRVRVNPKIQLYVSKGRAESTKYTAL